MGALTTSKIKDTYPGLIKTTDNAAINATPKSLEDGLGNTLPVQVGTGGMIYSGTQDFSGATVTGIPDEDTTYTLSAAQSGSDVNVNLTGSDSTVDTVKLVAGSNVTLTQSGDNITIAAAGGGGGGTTVYGMGESAATLKIWNNNGFLKAAHQIQGQMYTAYSDVSDTAQALYWMPFIMKPGDTINKLATFIAQQTTSGGVFRMGVYASDGTNATPSTRIYDSGDVTVTSTGFKFLTGLSITVPSTGVPGLIWVCVYQKSSTMFRIGQIADSSSRQTNIMWSYDRLNVAPGYTAFPSFKEAFTDATLPATYTANTGTNGGERSYAVLIG